MKNIIFFMFFGMAATSSLFGQSASAPVTSPIQAGAYIPGIVNPRDYANPGTSGLMAIDYNIFFNTNQYIDRDGNKVDQLDLGDYSAPLDIDVSGYLNALAIVYVSPELPFLGNARYLTFISPYYATAHLRVALSELADTSLTVDGGTGGFGDLTIAPLYLTWSLGEDKFDITTGYMVTAPTGRYVTGADDNIGLGYWNHAIQLFTYYYLMDKATALYVGNTFEFHSAIKDVDVRPGSRYTLEYGISQYLTERLEVNVQGGLTMQVANDIGNDVYINFRAY